MFMFQFQASQSTIYCALRIENVVGVWGHNGKNKGVCLNDECHKLLIIVRSHVVL